VAGGVLTRRLPQIPDVTVSDHPARVILIVRARTYRRNTPPNGSPPKSTTPSKSSTQNDQPERLSSRH
jgi:hypothetical protein